MNTLYKDIYKRLRMQHENHQKYNFSERLIPPKTDYPRVFSHNSRIITILLVSVQVYCLIYMFIYYKYLYTKIKSFL